MKKPIFLRSIGLVAVYAGIFILLVSIQFANRRNFTLKVGDFVVSGSYDAQETAETLQGAERLLEGEAGIVYGGMAFFLTDDDGDDSLSLLTGSGSRERARPAAMTVSDRAVLFRLSGGAEISFASRHSGGTQELQISVTLPEDCQALELPYRLLRSSRIRRNADGESYVIAGGKNYRLNASTVDFARRLIVIDSREPAASYGTVPGTEAFDPSRFILAAARDKGRYDEALNHWLDRSFALWRLSPGSAMDEETALAYLAESVPRGVYQSAVTALSTDFSRETEWSFMPAVYLGRMDQGLRSSIVYERENFSRLSRLIADGSADFLKDPHAVEFLAVRGHSNLIDSGAAIVNGIDGIDPDLIPGILEGYADWLLYRPSEDNPFEELADQACFSLSGKIAAGYKGERIAVFDGETADLEYNSRLGAGLIAYGEHTGQEVWTEIGRSLVLSVLAFVGKTGTAPLALRLAANGEIEADSGATLSSARIYRLLRLGDYSARAAGLHAAANGVWTLTAASGVTANFDQENNMLDIAAVFPRGETHYMFIRGIRPFTQIRLYGIPFRTDPRFEGYDSSGWAYSPSEQTLMVKMKHQLPTEHIQIYY